MIELLYMNTTIPHLQQEDRPLNMNESCMGIWHDVLRIRAEGPLVHNITNYVVMNSSANALLALGASPVMAHAIEEVGEMTKLARALVINIGTVSGGWLDAMCESFHTARERGIPVVIDPVGVGATSFRLQAVQRLLAFGSPTVVRGNASEIKALLHGGKAMMKGVDSIDEPDARLASQLARQHGCTVCVSGAIDSITDGKRVRRVANGHPLMTKVTGLGCTASAMIAAFCAVNSDPIAAAAGAMVVLGVAGEIAAARARGPGSLQLEILDALHALSEEDLSARLRMEPA